MVRHEGIRRDAPPDSPGATGPDSRAHMESGVCGEDRSPYYTASRPSIPYICGTLARNCRLCGDLRTRTRTGCRALERTHDHGLPFGFRGRPAVSHCRAAADGRDPQRYRDSPERVLPGRNIVPVVVMVARFSSFKDHVTIVRAFAELNIPARLQLVGDGPTRSATERLVADLGIRDRVEFPGDRDDIAQLLCRADIFVLASKLDNLPISILEAMRAGLPVIASDVGGISELVIHGETGCLCRLFLLLRWPGLSRTCWSTKPSE